MCGAIVRIQIRLDADSVLNEKAIRDRLIGYGVSYVLLSKEPDRVIRSRLGENPERLTDLQLLDRYLIDKRIPDASRELLLRKAQELIGVGTH